MRIALMVNPSSGSAPDPDEAAAALTAAGAEVVELAKWPDQVDGNGAERLVVVSGDGLVAPAAAQAGELGIPLAVVPGGTANDFARAMGLPADPQEALEAAVTATTTRTMELAHVDGRPFVNVAGAGLAPEAGRRAAPTKGVLGPLAYPVGALWAGLASSPLGCRVLVDGREVHAGRTWQVSVASTGAFGGGASIDKADPCDGELDVFVLPASPRVELPRFALGMRRGTLADQRGVLHERGTCVELVMPPGTPMNVDGELVEAGGLSRFDVTPAAFELVVPVRTRSARGSTAAGPRSA